MNISFLYFMKEMNQNIFCKSLKNYFIVNFITNRKQLFQKEIE